MSTSAPPSKLPAWIFYVTDLALLAAAVFIAAQSSRPLPNSAIFAIVACVIAGAIVATVPRLVEYEREKNAALDERQSALEALAQTITSSAEQISVAATGLHAIAELTHKNLRQAEQLPHKLQDKIAEFQAQLANADDAEKEELEKELVALRSSESERLESISDRIAKSVAEFARLQAQLQKQLAAAPALLTRGPASAPPFAVTSPEPAAAKPADEFRPAVPPAPIAATDSDLPSPTPARKTPRSPRRDELPPVILANGSGSVGAAQAVSLEEPPPVKPVEIAPVVPSSRPPYPDDLVTLAPQPIRKRAERKTPEAPPENLLGLEIPTTSAKSVDGPELAASPASKGIHSPTVEDSPVSAPSADGATRLLVTAYIGIGNRLFVRGEGPGLNWEKGVPLHFVSIGKWRWEAAGAAAPVKFKLYKNDEAECTNLGLQTLAAGHQQELTAAF